MGGRGASSHRATAGVFGRDMDLTGYYNPSSLQDAIDQHINNLSFNQAIWGALSFAERSGITAYTGSYYRSMNDALFGKTQASGSIQTAIDNATSGMDKMRISFNTVVVRGDKPEDMASLLGGTLNQLADPAFLRRVIGETVEFKGFMSSAIHESMAWTGKGVTTIIKVPKGTAGFYVDPVSANSGEQEFLFQRGTRLKVHKIVRDSMGRLRVYLEVV